MTDNWEQKLDSVGKKINVKNLAFGLLFLKKQRKKSIIALKVKTLSDNNYFLIFFFKARVRVETLLHSLEEVGSTILSRTLVGEGPKELPAQAMSLLVSRQEPYSLAGTVLSNKGNSFQLPPASKLFDNSGQFVDCQVCKKPS